jgi:hypothetical protein
MSVLHTARTLMRSLEYVDITDVEPDSLKIRARFLQVGDKVFDALGDTHELVKVKTLKNGNISTRRNDQLHTEHWSPDTVITIIRGGTK